MVSPLCVLFLCYLHLRYLGSQALLYPGETAVACTTERCVCACAARVLTTLLMLCPPTLLLFWKACFCKGPSSPQIKPAHGEVVNSLCCDKHTG